MQQQRRGILRWGLTACCALGISVLTGVGCSEVKPAAPQTPTVAEATRKAEHPPEHPDMVSTRLEEQRREPEKRQTLRFSNADVRGILRSFSKTTPFNFIYGPDVQGLVTVELKNVTLEEALKAILFPIHLDFVKEGNFIRVHPQQMETRVFNIAYVNTMRTGVTSTFAGSVAGGAGGVGGFGGAAGGGLAGGLAGGGAAGGLAGGGAGGGVGGGIGRGAPGASFSSVISTDRADVFEDLEKTVKAMLSKGGKVSVNRTASTLVVTDFRFQLDQVESYLTVAQSSLQRQVRIQINIAEVTLNKEFQAGIDWAAAPKLLGGTGVASAAGVTNKVFAQSFASDVANRVEFGVRGRDFSAILNWLSTTGTVNFVSRPTLSTLNNQRALIQVGTQQVFFLVSNIVSTAITPGQVFSIPQTVFVGLTLAVTPHISEDGTITMTILPTDSEVQGVVANPILNQSQSQSSGATVPVLSVREAQTVVRVHDEDTIILGGLMQDRKTKNILKVPFFGDIPYIGKAFQRIDEVTDKTELVFFLTPTIVDSKTFDSMAQETQRATERALGR